MNTDTILTGSDRMNSVLWRSDAQQLVNYTAYGIPDADVPGDIGFNGERHDPVSGTTHLGNGYRAYSPVLMRFICPDSLSPFGPGGINPYAYCSGDPINHSDPSGHMSWQAGLSIGLGIVGILGAIFTGGASIGLAEGAVIALGVVADTTGIASAATADTSPEASTVLGWVALGSDIFAGMAGIGMVAMKGTGWVMAQRETENVTPISMRAILRNQVTNQEGATVAQQEASTTICAPKNAIEILFRDLGDWRDINKRSNYPLQNTIYPSMKHEVKLSLDIRNGYVLENQSSGIHSRPDGTYVFVNPSDDPGRVYAMQWHSSNKEYNIGHTSLTSGKPVRYAGTMDFNNGDLISWNNESGHYIPPGNLHHVNLIPWVRRLLPPEKFKCSNYLV